MRLQIEKTAALALDFWGTGTARAAGDWEGWLVSVCRSEGEKEISVNLVGPSSDGDLAAGGVTIYPQESRGEPADDLSHLFHSVLRRLPEERRGFQELLNCRLFWPAKRPALWAKAQVSI